MMPVGHWCRSCVAQPASDDSLCLSCHDPVIPRLDLRLNCTSVTYIREIAILFHTVSLDYSDLRGVITQGGGIVTTAVMPDSGSRTICEQIQFLFRFWI